MVWGLTSRPPVSPCGLSSGFPFARRVPPFVRLLLVSLRPAFSGLFPSAVAQVPVPLRCPPGSLPLSNLHVSAAVRRFRRRWSRAAGTKVTSPAATTSPGSRDPPALQMGSGGARWDVATESPVTSGRERRTSPRPNRQLGGYRVSPSRELSRLATKRHRPVWRASPRRVSPGYPRVTLATPSSATTTLSSPPGARSRAHLRPVTPSLTAPRLREGGERDGGPGRRPSSSGDWDYCPC